MMLDENQGIIQSDYKQQFRRCLTKKQNYSPAGRNVRGLHSLGIMIVCAKCHQQLSGYHSD